MNRYSNLVATLVREESGQDLIEYALVAALVGIAAITSMKALSTAITNAFNNISNSLTTSV